MLLSLSLRLRSDLKSIDIILSPDEMKVIAKKKRGIKDYKNKSKDDLIKIHDKPKTKISLSKKRIEDLRKDVNKSRHIVSKSKIKQIRKSLYNIKNQKNLSKSEQMRLKKIFLNLKKVFLSQRIIMMILNTED